jgi:hypothetical protein
VLLVAPPPLLLSDGRGGEELAVVGFHGARQWSGGAGCCWVARRKKDAGHDYCWGQGSGSVLTHITRAYISEAACDSSSGQTKKNKVHWT